MAKCCTVLDAYHVAIYPKKSQKGPRWIYHKQTVIIKSKSKTAWVLIIDKFAIIR